MNKLTSKLKETLTDVEVKDDVISKQKDLTTKLKANKANKANKASKTSKTSKTSKSEFKFNEKIRINCQVNDSVKMLINHIVFNNEVKAFNDNTRKKLNRFACVVVLEKIDIEKACKVYDTSKEKLVSDKSIDSKFNTAKQLHREKISSKSARQYLSCLNHIVKHDKLEFIRSDDFSHFNSIMKTLSCYTMTERKKFFKHYE